MKRRLCNALRPITRRHVRLERILIHGKREVLDVTRCAWCKTPIAGESKAVQYPKPGQKRQVLSA